ncbi:MAG TPA: PIN domain-containing protein [Pyrinomonadaceae bacterium]|jgi:predicted nucleic acid-binding protein
MARVIDTNVFSYFLKEDTRADLYLPHITNQFLIVSFMTVAEIEVWALRANWGIKRNAKFEKTLRRYFVQGASRQVYRLWAKVIDEGRKSGANIEQADAWIAATALYFNIPLVTHNRTDFQSVNGLQVISEQ